MSELSDIASIDSKHRSFHYEEGCTVFCKRMMESFSKYFVFVYSKHHQWQRMEKEREQSLKGEERERERVRSQLGKRKTNVQRETQKGLKS